jgi:hypothetical protein
MIRRDHLSLTGKWPTIHDASAAKNRSRDLLAYEDQAMLMVHRYAGQEAVIQVLWLYQRPVHRGELRKFHYNLGRGILARRIVRSPLPFGRARWLSVTSPQAELVLADSTLPAEKRHDWTELQVRLPLDPELGPSWHLSYQMFEDNSTIVSLVISHCIADGGATIMAICDAVNGTNCDLGYPSSTSRNYFRRLLIDLRQIAIDLPAIFAALRSGVRMMLKRADANIPPQSRRKKISPLHLHGYDSHHTDQDQHVQVPSVSLFTSTKDWDALAQSRKGNQFSLLLSVASSISKRIGRRKMDSINLSIPINLRQGSMDMGANRVAIAQLTIPSESLGTDLSALSKATRLGLVAARREPDAMLQLLPLITFLPRWGFRLMIDIAFRLVIDRSVTCSHFGAVPEEVLLIDGAKADAFYNRGIDRYFSRHTLERRQGIFTMLSGAIGSMLIVTFVAYQPGRANTRQELQQLVEEEMNELGIQVTFF